MPILPTLLMMKNSIRKTDSCYTLQIYSHHVLYFPDEGHPVYRKMMILKGDLLYRTSSQLLNIVLGPCKRQEYLLSSLIFPAKTKLKNIFYEKFRISILTSGLMLWLVLWEMCYTVLLKVY